jgi:pyridoxine 5-phosphate synthase
MAAGAAGITVHLREDRRHIQDADVYAVRNAIPGILNLEMANAAEIVDIALDVGPDEVCVVPEKREELTTEGGLDVAGQQDAIAASTARLKAAGIAVSLFIEGDERQIRASAECGADYVELHTGTYCELGGDAAQAELARLTVAARLAHDLGLRVNAGHGINLQNIAGILRIPYLHTLNIGHSIVARSVMVGLTAAVSEMLASMSAYDGGER